MRWARICIFIAIGALACLALLAGVALQPAIQTWALRHYLAARPQLHASVEAISANFGQVQVRNLRIERNGAVLSAPSVTAELSPLSLLFGRAVSIHRLTIRDWTLDLTRMAWRRRAKSIGGSATRPGAPESVLSSAHAEAIGPTPQSEPVVAAFSGLFHRLTLPHGLRRLDGLEGEGNMLVPPPTGRAGIALRVHARFGGGGLKPGGVGHFTFETAQAFPPGAAPVNSLGASGIVEATLNSAGAVTRLVVRINAAARGEEFPGGVRLSADLGAARGAFGETYTLTLARDGKKLASGSAQVLNNAPRLTGDWKFNLADSDLSPFALGRILPVFTVVGEGHFDTDETLDLAHVSGELDARLDRLGILWPKLEGVGTVRLKANFDLTHHRGLLRVDQLQASLDGARPILSVRALQAFAFNARSGELQVADSARDLVSLAIQGVPIEWARPFFPDLILTGHPIRGEFVASARKGGLAFHSNAPLAMVGLSVGRGGRLMLEALDLSLRISADYTPQGWQSDMEGTVADAGVRDPRTLFTVSAKFGRLAGAGQPVKVTGQFKSDLPAWAAQPGFPNLPPVVLGVSNPSPGNLSNPAKIEFTDGLVAGDFSASLGQERSLQAKFAVTDLTLGSGSTVERWPLISGTVRAYLGKDGRVAFDLPLVVKRPDRNSDLTVSGTLARTRPGLSFDLRITGARLALDDAKILAELLALRSDGSRGGANGRITLALKQIDAGNWTATGVKGTLRAVAGAVEIHSLAADLAGGGDVRINGVLSYANASPQAYGLKADIALDNFDATPLFRALDPDHPPMLEGRCSVTARLSSRANRLRELLTGARGEFNLTSREGVIRALRAELVADIKQAPSRLSEAVNTVTSLFGKSNAAQPFIDKQGQIVMQITDAFKEIRYDQLRVTADRDADFNLRLNEFALISPEIRLAGTGQITHQDGILLRDQPFELTVNLGARGHLAALMNEVGLLNGRQDDLGYTGLTSSVHLGGTLDNIDETQWKDMLIKAAMRKAAGNLLDKLLGF